MTGEGKAGRVINSLSGKPFQAKRQPRLSSCFRARAMRSLGMVSHRLRPSNSLGISWVAPPASMVKRAALNLIAHGGQLVEIWVPDANHWTNSETPASRPIVRPTAIQTGRLALDVFMHHEIGHSRLPSVETFFPSNPPDLTEGCEGKFNLSFVKDLSGGKNTERKGVEENARIESASLNSS